jgi:hypothetical protein
LSARKVRVRNAFTEPTDLWHVLIGFLSGVLLVFTPFGWLVSLFIALVFFVYEGLEAEDRVSSFEDLSCWLCGFALGLIVALGLRLNGGV